VVTTSPPDVEAGLRTPAADVVVNTAKPVKWWAGVGAGWLALTVYEWSDWLASGHAHPTPRGPSHMSSLMSTSLVVWQVLFGGGALVVTHLFLVRPWRRTGHLTFDGMFLAAWVLCWAVQDPWFNYTSQWFNYNSHFVNLGCPQCHVPGWLSPHREYVTEPVIFIVGLYVVALFLGSVALNALMRKVKQRRPRTGTVGMVAVAFATMMIADLVCEVAWAHTGTYSYVGVRGPVLFRGHYFQFPLFQMVTWGWPWAAIACIRYFRDDRGESPAERGLHEVKASPTAKQGLRFLAICGMVDVIFFLGSNVPSNYISLHVDAVPRQVQQRSYLTNQQCGPSTDFACPGPHVPVPRGNDSGHLRPDGTYAPGS